MATTVGQHSVAAFTSPVNGTTPIDANSVRGNDNTMRSAYVDHDADTGIHVQSSTLASRPAAGTAGRKWITEDSGVYTLWFDDGTNWHPVSSENVALTVLAGENLAKGDVVKVTGWNNGQDLPEVVKTTSASDTAFAVITAAVTNGAMGYATNTGIVQDVNTAAYSAGAVLYANGSGGFTATKPTSGHYQPCAYVLRSNTNNGVIYVEFSAPRIVESSSNTASTIVLRDSNGDFSAGTVTATTLAGTLSTAAQPNVTSVGTLTSLTVSGNLAVDTNTLYVDAANNRVGVGTASPGDKLDVSGGNARISASVYGSDGLLRLFGTASNEVMQLGPYSASLGAIYGGSGVSLAFYSNALERMRLDASGNLGLGVTPSAWGTSSGYNALQLKNASLYFRAAAAELYFNNNAYYNGTNWIYLQSLAAGRYDIEAGAHKWYNAPSGTAGNAITFTQAMTLDASGNLGLGVTPSAWTSASRVLQIGGATNNRLAFNGTVNTVSSNAYWDTANNRWEYIGTGNAVAYAQDTGSHVWLTSASGTADNPITFTQAMTLNSTGNLGLGTDTPTMNGGGTSKVMHINAAGANEWAIVHYTNSTTGTGGSDGVITGLIGTDGYLSNYETGSLIFGTGGGTERARITSEGDFLVGLTAVIQDERLSVEKDLNGKYLVRFRNTNATSPVGAFINYTAASPNGTGNNFLLCSDSTATRVEIRSNGGLANYQSNNVDLSDARTKTDITPAASMWDKIGALEIVTYKYVDQTHDDVNVGVIAQQVEAVEPVWVDSDGWDKEVVEGEEPLKTVYTKDITFAAIKALQEAMARIEALEVEVAALKAGA